MWDFIGRAFERACSQEEGRGDGEEDEEEDELTFTELTVLVNFLLDKVPLVRCIVDGDGESCGPFSFAFVRGIPF